jgi:hypothetical protein
MSPVVVTGKGGQFSRRGTKLVSDAGFCIKTHHLAKIWPTGAKIG